jgi:hypothetical protein
VASHTQSTSRALAGVLLRVPEGAPWLHVASLLIASNTDGIALTPVLAVVTGFLLLLLQSRGIHKINLSRLFLV